MNSYSTNTKALAGGWQGRRLEKGDEIKFGESKIYYAGLLKQGKDLQPLGWKACIRKMYDQPNEISLLQARMGDGKWNIKRSVLNTSFSIHSLSDRMGYHLKGYTWLSMNTKITFFRRSFGTMQLLPNGQMIVLMADHQTTGGYPRIGHIISANLQKLAQLRPGWRPI